jgi:peptidoglycan/LPS O-acetylase OafA/YrhL
MTTNPATVTRLPQRNLDVLRACAVLGVLANHLDVAVNDPSMTRQWIANWLGRAGVLAFFVHTSLVLMSSLERQSGGAVAFYIRRALRIYPLAMFAVLAVRLFHITPWIPQIGRQAHFTLASWKAVGANMLLVQNLVGVRDITSVLWTLPIEVQMYLVLPACYVLATRGVGTVLVALAVGVAGGYL